MAVAGRVLQSASRWKSLLPGVQQVGSQNLKELRGTFASEIVPSYGRCLLRNHRCLVQTTEDVGGISGHGVQRSVSEPGAEPRTNGMDAKVDTVRAGVSVNSGVVEAAARIFGNVLGNGLRSGRKVLRKKLAGEKIVAWYPEPIQKSDPCYEDPAEKRRILKLERLKRRGKGPPKKGHGKRASKK